MIDNDRIKVSLEKILTHEIFAGSPQARKFLEHVVEAHLAGRADGLTEITVAQDVFGKGADYDPSLHSVVRVTARRVRQMLALYYAQTPHNSQLKISIPKGHYLPHFELNENEASTDQNLVETRHEKNVQIRQSGFIRPVSVTLACLLAVGSFMFSGLHFLTKNVSQGVVNNDVKIDSNDQFIKSNVSVTDYPFIAVTPFENKTGETKYNFLSTALQRQLVSDLARYEYVRPFMYDGSVEMAFREGEEDYDYVFSGLVLNVAPQLDLNVKLIDKNTLETIYDRRIKLAVDSDQYYEKLTNIVTNLSGDFASTNGAISNEKLERIKSQMSAKDDIFANIEAMECVTLTNTVDDFPGPEIFKSAYQCLERHLRDDPDNATLLAFFGGLTYTGAVSYEEILKARSVNPDINAQDGLDMIDRALDIDPGNGFARAFRAEYYQLSGDKLSALEQAELAYIAYPGDPEIVALVSRHFAANDQWDRAVSLASEALDRTPTPKPRYYHPLFTWALLNDDKAGVQKWAEKIAAFDYLYKDIFLFIAASENGDQETIETLRPKMTAFATRDGNKDRLIEFVALGGQEDVKTKVWDVFIREGIYSADREVNIPPG